MVDTNEFNNDLVVTDVQCTADSTGGELHKANDWRISKQRLTVAQVTDISRVTVSINVKQHKFPLFLPLDFAPRVSPMDIDKQVLKTKS